VQFAINYQNPVAPHLQATASNHHNVSIFTLLLWEGRTGVAWEPYSKATLNLCFHNKVPLSFAVISPITYSSAMFSFCVPGMPSELRLPASRFSLPVEFDRGGGGDLERLYRVQPDISSHNVCHCACALSSKQGFVIDVGVSLFDS
jgi:hypothetical protein